MIDYKSGHKLYSCIVFLYCIVVLTSVEEKLVWATLTTLNCLKACKMHLVHCISPLKRHIYLACVCN